MGEFAIKLWLKILGWTTTIIIIAQSKLLFDIFMPESVLKRSTAHLVFRRRNSLSCINTF